MGKSTSGPDMTDLAPMMAALGGVHSARVELIVSPDGLGSHGTVKVSAIATFDLLPGSSLPSTVAVVSTWPNKDGRTFYGHCFNELWQLDWAISQAYNQLPLAGS